MRAAGPSRVRQLEISSQRSNDTPRRVPLMGSGSTDFACSLHICFPPISDRRADVARCLKAYQKSPAEKPYGPGTIMVGFSSKEKS